MCEKHGIDISQIQHQIDWAKTKSAGVEFVMIRTGGGRSSRIDDLFERHYAGARSVGIPVGVYWDSHAVDVDGAKREAAEFLQAISGKSFEFPAALVLEDPVQRELKDRRLTDIAVAFLEKLEGAGYYTALRSSLVWLCSRFDYERIRRFDLWLAQWRRAGITYENPVGLWQYTTAGSVDGIAGPVGRDIAYRDYAQLIRSAGMNGFHSENADSKSAGAP